MFVILSVRRCVRHTAEILSLSLDLFFKILLFQVAFLLFISIAIFSLYFLRVGLLLQYGISLVLPLLKTDVELLSPMTSRLNGRPHFFHSFFLMLNVTCRFCIIFVWKYNDSHVDVMIIRLVWTIWTRCPLSEKAEKNHSLIHTAENSQYCTYTSM